MPAKSKAQQQAAGAALSAKRGETKLVRGTKSTVAVTIASDHRQAGDGWAQWPLSCDEH